MQSAGERVALVIIIGLMHEEVALGSAGCRFEVPDGTFFILPGNRGVGDAVVMETGEIFGRSWDQTKLVMTNYIFFIPKNIPGYKRRVYCPVPANGLPTPVKCPTKECLLGSLTAQASRVSHVVEHSEFFVQSAQRHSIVQFAQNCQHVHQLVMTNR